MSRATRTRSSSSSSSSARSSSTCPSRTCPATRGTSRTTSRVTGAYFVDGTQHLDYDTFQEHIAPSTTSDFAFKGALNDTASSVWRGMIRVERDAQKTNAYQENRNLLLSPEAHADSIPGL